ncbi:MAG: hypothetical protein ACK413_01025 [Patescibacteria group bacterium]
MKTNKFSSRQILFLLLFFTIVFAASKISLFKIVGSNQSFTLFEFLYPLPAAFLGSLWGGGIVLLVKILNWLLTGQSLDLITFVRFFPAVFAAIYFASKSKWNLIVPIICMILFWSHPIGRAAFPYGIFWLIPILVFPFKKNLPFNALGSTFIAHAIGSTAFLYSLPMSPEIWRGLIPVVLMERFIFATGISFSYVVFSLTIKYILKKVREREIVAQNVIR